MLQLVLQTYLAEFARDDGSVEILMSGDEEKIDEMIKSCYRGPIFARVDKISFLPGVSNYFLPQIQKDRFIRI